MKKTKKDDSIFELYAHEYDLMTCAAGRRAHHEQEVAAMVDRFKPESVLDAGCATGMTAALFAERGIRAVGIDRSSNMLKEARRKYGDTSLPVEFRLAHFEKLPKLLHGKFDLVACLANSISGIGTLSRLRQSLKNFYAVLKPGGHLVLQLLNFAAIKENTLYPIKTTNHSGLIYQRFSERRGNRFYVYVTRSDLNAKPPGLKVFRHEFDRFTVDEMIRAMKFSDFRGVRKYGDLFLEKTFSAKSRDVVITGRRPD